MKQYNCPDCTHTEDNCENCSRYQGSYKTNLDEYNPWWPYQATITPTITTTETLTKTLTDIPFSCQICSNHPSNGGSGICFCINRQQIFY